MVSGVYYTHYHIDLIGNDIREGKLLNCNRRNRMKTEQHTMWNNMYRMCSMPVVVNAQ